MPDRPEPLFRNSFCCQGSPSEELTTRVRLAPRISPPFAQRPPGLSPFSSVLVWRRPGLATQSRGTHKPRSSLRSPDPSELNLELNLGLHPVKQGQSISTREINTSNRRLSSETSSDLAAHCKTIPATRSSRHCRTLHNTLLSRESFIHNHKH